MSIHSMANIGCSSYSTFKRTTIISTYASEALEPAYKTEVPVPAVPRLQSHNLMQLLGGWELFCFQSFRFCSFEVVSSRKLGHLVIVSVFGLGLWIRGLGLWVARESLRAQVLNIYILTQTVHYNYYYPHPKYVVIGYLDFYWGAVWQGCLRFGVLLRG